MSDGVNGGSLDLSSIGTVTSFTSTIVEVSTSANSTS